ncbi:hypothetical protein Tco_1468163 [Tanacetum coccineum]
MESEKYLEGQSMQRPPLFESDGFIYWKNRFETYVKSKDLDLWHVITDGDFPPIQFNPETKKDEIVSFHKQDDDLKKKLAKNNEAKMVIYNALPRKEYERIFMCQTAKEIWDTLLITHQGNNQVKANKIDLLVQQYEQFMIPEEESIDNAFAKFNTIITSLKALDESFSSKNCVRKFLRALHPKWRAKVTAIEESKNLTTLKWKTLRQASKKQTCITGSTMESEFVALAAAGKEAEWLRNLILEIPLWSKPIAPISIRCDSAATLAKAYSQMYNGKSRHLGVRHSMIRELITNGVISIEFVRSQQNLADHLTKGLARDLVIKSAEGM